MNNNKKALFNEAKQFTKYKVQKGQAENPGSGQAGSNRQNQEHGQDDGEKDTEL